jgi:putative ABC transport system permease protein
MIGPRWRKVLRDLWHNKTRTVLVVLSIAVGMFAVGTIVSTWSMLQHDLGCLHLRRNLAASGGR